MSEFMLIGAGIGGVVACATGAGFIYVLFQITTGRRSGKATTGHLSQLLGLPAVWTGGHWATGRMVPAAASAGQADLQTGYWVVLFVAFVAIVILPLILWIWRMSMQIALADSVEPARPAAGQGASGSSRSRGGNRS